MYRQLSLRILIQILTDFLNNHVPSIEVDTGNSKTNERVSALKKFMSNLVWQTDKELDLVL